jgi:hypothetical protein
MRLFSLVRDEDVSGISGTGPIAEGVEFTDGSVALRWLVAWLVSGHTHDREARRWLNRLRLENGKTRNT